MQKLNTLYNKFGHYIVGILILAIPLYPKFPFITIPGTYVGIRLEDFLLAFAATFLFFGQLTNMKSYLKDTTIRLILVFWIIGLVSVFSAILLTQSVSLHLALLHWMRRIEYMICFAIGMSSVIKREHIRFYVICIAVVIVYAFVYGVGQKYFNWPIVTTQNEEYSKGVALRYVEGGHLVATFAGHYDMASFLILTLPLMLGVFASRAQVIKPFALLKSVLATRIAFGSVFLMGLWLLTMSASRISIVSYLGSALLVLILMRRYLFIPLLIVVTLLVSSLSGSLISRYMNIYDVTVKKILSIEIVKTVHAAETAPSEDRSTNIRLNIEWPRAIRAVTRNPFLGTGYSSITLATDNDYLRMLGEVGILGAVSFALVILSIVSHILPTAFTAHKGDIETLFVAAIFASLPGVFLNMVFIDILEASKFAIMFWLMLGISYGISINSSKFKK